MKQNPPLLLVVGAHHDDNELIGGTLLRHRAEGWRVVSVVMTDSDYIDGKASADYIKIRESESRAAAKVLDIECEFLHFKDGQFQSDTLAREALTRLIRRYRPDLVITHPPRDYHIDHMNVSRSVWEAVHASWNPGVLPAIPVCKAPKLYYCDAWFVPFEPDEYVNIADQMNRKIDALACHRSQLPVTDSAGDDMLEAARLQSQQRGMEAGVKFAEAFRLVANLGSVRCHTLLGG